MTTALNEAAQPVIEVPAARAATGRAATRRGRRGKRMSAWHFVLFPLAILFLVPFAQMALASFSPAKELVAFPPPFIPSRLTIDGFTKLFGQTDILLWLGNSAIVSVTAIVSNLVLCSLAGYGFARLKFAGRNFGFLMIIATIMIPTQLLMVPTYILFSKLGLLNGLGAAIVPWLATAFGIFLMRQFFLSLPAELEEAGMIDGCNKWQVFFRIVLPLAKPALATLAIFTLLGAWNDLVWPLIAINNQQAFTVQLGIANFQGAHRIDWSLIMAGNVIATLPLIVFFLFAQRQFIATMTFSGLKG
jgi:multiple sugar transport system permease protein